MSFTLEEVRLSVQEDCIGVVNRLVKEPKDYILQGKT